ncbi:DNA/RNA polymerases superfamily protein [Gossypium australe]|uniref:DNA/RNA polymerases superfamily protein n=1 Tax=Gossypium australe TaxID=47621 RepID=A0A5B6W7H0_9ROSI|nr:DNA/RNA polymerases superfamily protein [Gossypium australe]
MTYNEEHVNILAREVKELRNKQIALVKVLWVHHGVGEATWEPEEAMKLQYLNLFSNKIFDDENSIKVESCNNLFSVVSKIVVSGSQFRPALCTGDYSYQILDNLCEQHRVMVNAPIGNLREHYFSCIQIVIPYSSGQETGLGIGCYKEDDVDNP